MTTNDLGQVDAEFDGIEHMGLYHTFVHANPKERRTVFLRIQGGAVDLENGCFYNYGVFVSKYVVVQLKEAGFTRR